MGVIPDKFAMMTVDPGGTTGVAQGLFNVARLGDVLTTRRLLKRAMLKKVIRVDQIYPASAYRGLGRLASVSMSVQIYRVWLSFQYRCLVELGVPMPYIFLVFEDFALRQRSAELSPVEVTSGVLTLLATGEIEPNGMGWPSIRPEQQLRFQMPSDAMTYATNERLKSWGVYPLTVGKEHARDALRHLALGASKVMDGDWSDLVR